MAAEDKKNGVCDCGHGCGCGGHGMGGHWTFFLLRVLITILILMVVFWFGLAVGRMSSGFARETDMTRTGYAYPGGVYNGVSGTGAVPMMQINGATSTSTTGGVQNY